MNFLFTDLAPHNVDNIQREHSYLLTVLQQEENTAIEIRRNISHLERKLSQDHPQNIRRKDEKQLVWLQSRLVETTRQKQAILVQLRQISSTIQGRRWLNSLKSENGCLWLSSGQQIYPQSPVLAVSEKREFGCAECPISQDYFTTPFSPSMGQTQLSPLSPPFEPSTISTANTSFTQSPWQCWPTLALPLFVHSAPTKFINSPLTLVTKAIGSSKEAMSNKTAVFNEHCRAAPRSKPISSPLRNNNHKHKSTEVRDTLPIQMILANAAIIEERVRRASMSADNLIFSRPENLQGKFDENGVFHDPKFHSVPSLSQGARRSSLPPLFVLRTTWTASREEQMEFESPIGDEEYQLTDIEVNGRGKVVRK